MYTWEDLQIPLRSKQLLSPTGQAVMSGPSNEYHIKVNAKLSGKHVPEADIAGEIKGDGKHIEVVKASGNILDGSFQVSGEFAWSPYFYWHITLQGDNLDPSLNWPVQPGRINMIFKADGKIDKKTGYENSIVIPKLEGQLNGKSVDGHVELSLHKRNFNLKNTYLTIGENNLKVTGGVDEDWQFYWYIAIDDLRQLLPNATGRIGNQGEVIGDRQNPKL